MTRQRIRVEVTEKTFVIRGWRANVLATDAGIKVVYAGTVAGWMGDTSRLGDLLAYLDHRRLRYELTDLTGGKLSNALDRSEQPGLFDGPDAA